jgi:hypothetical protein
LKSAQISLVFNFDNFTVQKGTTNLQRYSQFLTRAETIFLLQKHIHFPNLQINPHLPPILSSFFIFFQTNFFILQPINKQDLLQKFTTTLLQTSFINIFAPNFSRFSNSTLPFKKITVKLNSKNGRRERDVMGNNKKILD